MFNNRVMELLILDNSVVELGGAVDENLLAEAAHIVNPTHIVLPDVMLNGLKTLEHGLRALEWNLWDDHDHDQHAMYLPQGSTLNKFARCAEPLANDPRITMWGVPRNVAKYHGSRRDAIRLLHALNPNRRIHLFGFSDDMVDDLLCAQMPEVFSIDSAVPLRVKNFHIYDHVPPREGWWDTGQASESMFENLKLARALFGGGGSGSGGSGGSGSGRGIP